MSRRSSGSAARDAWAADIGAGAVVCLVAIPLCLGISLASGAPLQAGLITGILGGLFVSWAGGTQLLVSGPAAGLAAIVLAAIAELGSFSAFLAALVVAGLMQLGLGLARAGRLAGLVPSSVITGMLAAIGVLLILQQTPHALGVRPEGDAHGLGLLLVPLRAASQAVVGPTLISAVVLGVLAAWERPALDRVRGLLPGPLVAVVAGTVAAALLPWVAPDLALAPGHFVDLPDLAADPAALFSLPDWSRFTDGAVWRIAVTLAVVASLETLLSLEATDRLDPLRRRSDPDRELVAQGIGNTVAGLVGGLPMTGVIVRSATNVEAGGRTWRAAFIHGLLLLVAVLLMPGLLEHIPLAALAAVLLHTGWKLAHPRRFVASARLGVHHLVPLVITVAAVVATDLLVGVCLGLLASLVLTVSTAVRYGGGLGSLRNDGHALVAEAGGALRRVELGSAVSFLHKPKLHATLHGTPPGAAVVVDASRTHVIDPDVLELLHGFDEIARERGITYRLIDVPALRAVAGH